MNTTVITCEGHRQMDPFQPLQIALMPPHSFEPHAGPDFSFPWNAVACRSGTPSSCKALQQADPLS